MLFKNKNLQPNRTSTGRLRQAGVTLHETLISLGILGVLAAVSIPIYKTAGRYFEKNQAANVAEAVVARCRDTRLRAIRSGTAQPLNLSDLNAEGVAVSLFGQGTSEPPVFLPNGRCNHDYQCLIKSSAAEMTVRIDATGYAEEETSGRCGGNLIAVKPPISDSGVKDPSRGDPSSGVPSIGGPSNGGSTSGGSAGGGTSTGEPPIDPDPTRSLSKGNASIGMRSIRPHGTTTDTNSNGKKDDGSRDELVQPPNEIPIVDPVDEPPNKPKPHSTGNQADSRNGEQQGIRPIPSPEPPNTNPPPTRPVQDLKDRRDRKDPKNPNQTPGPNPTGNQADSRNGKQQGIRPIPSPEPPNTNPPPTRPVQDLKDRRDRKDPKNPNQTPGPNPTGNQIDSRNGERQGIRPIPSPEPPNTNPPPSRPVDHIRGPGNPQDPRNPDKPKPRP